MYSTRDKNAQRKKGANSNLTKDAKFPFSLHDNSIYLIHPSVTFSGIISSFMCICSFPVLVYVTRLEALGERYSVAFANATHNPERA